MPKIGMLYKVRGIQCRIVRILPAGTIDVESLCGQYAFRVTGLYRPGWTTVKLE